MQKLYWAKCPERGKFMSKNLSIFAEALVDSRDYKNAKINGEAVGVANSRKWIAAVKAIRIHAYAIRVYRYNNMGETETVAQCNETPVYDALAPILEMVGIVNGAKLNAHNIAEEVIANAMTFRVVDTSNEMAHARLEKKLAKQAMEEDENEDTISAYDHWVEEVKRLEGLPGNCKRIPEIVKESAFVRSVEILLGDAISKQTAKSAEAVAAEEEAKRQARREATKAKRAAKKAAAANA
jgi:hypothetical protein